MGARVVIQFQGIEETIARLTQIEEKAGENLVKQVKELSDDGKSAWRQATPRRKGRLQDEEDATPSGLSITFKSPTFYYDWVSEGHDTPKGWRRRRKDGTTYYQKAKRRSHVKGREMTEKLVDWLRQNTREYLSKFLDGV